MKGVGLDFFTILNRILELNFNLNQSVLNQFVLVVKVYCENLSFIRHEVAKQNRVTPSHLELDFGLGS